MKCKKTYVRFLKNKMEGMLRWFATVLLAGSNSLHILYNYIKISPIFLVPVALFSSDPKVAIKKDINNIIIPNIIFQLSASDSSD